MSIKFLSSSRPNTLLLAGGLIVAALLLVPYASNGFWFDDALNSQLYFGLNRVHGELGDFTYRVVMHWLLDEGRLMFGSFYGYPAFYVFHDLHALRIAQCVLVILNIVLYGYLLRLWGSDIRFIAVWSFMVAGLFQIHGAGLDPIAGYAFHYPVLGIQLSFILILFSKWQQENKYRFLFAALFCWLLFMTVYEVNFIFIPIALAIMFANGSDYRKLPGILVIVFACVYFALVYYLRNHASHATYSGTTFSLGAEMLPAYLKQLSATLPLSSYLFVTHHSISFEHLLKAVLLSPLAWLIFILSLQMLTRYIPAAAFARTQKKEALVISLGMLLLPAVFPAISERYQHEVGWGVGTLPVYYQDFGFAFLITWALSFIPEIKSKKKLLPILISCCLALSVTINSKMVKSVDQTWREPRETFAEQAKAGLFSQVRDGDIVYLKNVNNYVNSNLIFEWTGKRVFIPTDDHYWYPESPAKFSRTFELFRNRLGHYELAEMVVVADQPPIIPVFKLEKGKAVYQFIPPQEKTVELLDNFPAARSIIQFQIKLAAAGKLDTVDVVAPDGLGEWTTLPISNLWGVGILKGIGEQSIINNGPRKERLNLPVDRELIFWVPDNGSLTKCPELQIDLTFADGKKFSAKANCKYEPNKQ